MGRRVASALVAAAMAMGSVVVGAERGVTTAPATPTDARAVLLEQILDYRRYAETQWHAARGHAGMGYWGTGRAEGANEGARSQSINALVYALLAYRGDQKFPIAERVDPALRYTASTHVTGGIKGTKNDKWGNQWQSAMYAGNMGFAAILAQRVKGEHLSPETLEAVERVVAYEADRFVDQPVPEMLPGDTKAEENAWDLTAPAAAELLMPDHPHAAAWHEAVQRFGFNTIPHPDDRRNPNIFDGKPISEWVTTRQVFADWSLENHGIFHPVYSMVGPATNAQAAAMYTVCGRPVPYGLRFNVVRQWDECLKYIALPDGEWLYPQGLDWDLHDYEHINYWAALATQFDNSVAGLLEARTAFYARRRQVANGDGRFVGDSSSLGFAREAVQAERVAFSILMHDQAGAAVTPDDGAFARMVEGMPRLKYFPDVGLVVHRTPGGLVSFSFKNRLCGQVVPNSAKYLRSPYVTTPNAENLVGRFELAGQKGGEAGKFKVLKKAVAGGEESVAVVVDALVNDGKLRQQIAWVSAGPGVILYLDRVVAEGDVTVNSEVGVPVTIEDDYMTGDRRVLTTAAGEREVAGGADETVAVGGNWVNVDGKLGVIYAPDENATYRVAGRKYNRPGAREDLLAVVGAGPRAYKKGEVVAERGVVMVMNQRAGETGEVAGRISFGREKGTRRIEGPWGTLELAGDGVARWKGEEIVPK